MHGQNRPLNGNHVKPHPVHDQKNMPGSHLDTHELNNHTESGYETNFNRLHGRFVPNPSFACLPSLVHYVLLFKFKYTSLLGTPH